MAIRTIREMGDELLRKTSKPIKEMTPRIVSQQFDNTCEIVLSIRKSEADQLRSRLAKLL